MLYPSDLKASTMAENFSSWHFKKKKARRSFEFPAIEVSLASGRRGWTATTSSDLTLDLVSPALSLSSHFKPFEKRFSSSNSILV